MGNDIETSFSEKYKKLKPSIVAIAGKISSNPNFPDIIGTGFIAREDGIILTNSHVVEAISRLPKLKSDPHGFQADVLFFHWIPEKGMAIVPMEVKSVGILRRASPFEGYNYGEDIPDVGLIEVGVKGLPALKISEKVGLDEGEQVMLAGFPMGTRTLQAPGWIHQLTPTLQTGIISALLPFVCDAPHGMLLNVMVQGGSSGSPIFNPKTGEVIGILYAGLQEQKSMRTSTEKVAYQENTSLTLAVSANVLHEVYQKMNERLSQEKQRGVENFETIEGMVERLGLRTMKPKTTPEGIEVIPSDEIEFPKSAS